MMNKKMKIIVLSLLLSLTPMVAFTAEVSDSDLLKGEEITLIEGKVNKYNQDTKTVLLRLKSGEKVQIVLDWNTAFVGYSSPNEIEKGNKVKIWYSSEGKKETAVKVEKKLMVGC